MDVVWYWINLTDPVSQTIPSDPDEYWLLLNPDGTVEATGDCNSATGVFTLDGDELTIDFTQGSDNTCEPGSLSDLFLGKLEDASSYELTEDEDLLINLKFDAGTMRFSQE